MKEVIECSHQKGISLQLFKEKLTHYLKSPELRAYFAGEPIVLFGKSLNAIDLPFLNRDLGWDWMREHFSHRVCDLSSVCYFAMDRGLLPAGCERSSQLMKHFQMGQVAHTALEDARNTALLYLKLVHDLA
jgi:DNA polymerase-3 subunit epsilon